MCDQRQSGEPWADAHWLRAPSTASSCLLPSKRLLVECGVQCERLRCSSRPALTSIASPTLSTSKEKEGALEIKDHETKSCAKAMCARNRSGRCRFIRTLQ
eukprot:2353353-Rhodomonas_salina.2